MWTWGIRMGHDGAKIAGKMKRLFASFLFCPVVFTTPFLAFRRKHQNLIDLLSGTHLYRSGQ
jgi:hypothetical protein